MRNLLYTFFILVTVNSGYSKVLMQPYLQAVTKNSILILVETDSDKPINATIEISDNKMKTFTSNSFERTDATPNTFVHTIAITELKPSSTYSYNINDLGIIYNGNFKTAPKQYSQGNYRFTCFGNSYSAPEIFAKISNGLNSENPDFSICLGDISDDTTYKNWKNKFFIKEHLSFIKNVPFFNTIGDLEGWKTNTKAFTNSPISNSGSREYYSFDYGDIHFLVLSTESDMSENSPQWKFTENDLLKNFIKWKFVIFHKPAYSSGDYGENQKMINFTNKIFRKYSVDVILGSHSHFYQHNFVHKIHHFVFGGAGSKLTDPKEASYVLKSARENHYAVFNCSYYNIEMKVKNIDGEVIDEIIFEK